MSYCNENLSDAGCLEWTEYKPCPRVGKWTLETAGGPDHRRVWRFQRFVTCDFLQTQTVRTRSHPCRDTSERLETCGHINEMLERLLDCTHVTSATSGILTTFPLSTRSSRSSGRVPLSSPGVLNRSSLVRLHETTFSSSSSSRSLSDKYP